MKNKKIIVLLSVIFLFSTVGCSKKEGDENTKKQQAFSETNLKEKGGNMKEKENSEKSQDKQKEEPSYIKGEVLMKFKSKVDNSDHERIIKEYGCSIKSNIENLNVYKL